jgi:hypothetical protein
MSNGWLVGEPGSSTVRYVDASRPLESPPSAERSQRDKRDKRDNRALPVAVALLLGALAALAGMEAIRGVDSVETIAIGLFGVVALLAIRSISWGMFAATVATLGYGLLRRNSLDLATSSEVNRMVLGRGFGYLTFAAMVGVAGAVLRNSLAKSSVNITAETDADGGARDLFDREMDRAKRHHRPLSAITIDLTEADSTVDLGQGLRSSDYVLRGQGKAAGAVTLILPETDATGAAEIARRFEGVSFPKVISLLPGAEPTTDTTAQDDEVERLRARAATSHVS